MISIDGRAAPLDAALDRAASLLASARYPLVAGLGADVAGVRAALALAERLRGAVDHMSGDAIGREMSVLAEAGLLFVTPGEARARGDLVVLVGDLAPRAEWLASIFGPGPSPLRGTAPAREMIVLGASAAAAAPIAGAGPATVVRAPAGGLPGLLAAVAARVGGRKLDAARLGSATAKAVETVAERLKAARYGVVVWDAARLDGLSVELLAGLVKSLNAATRCAALPFPGDDGAMGATLTSGWTTGFPPRLGFRAGTPRHDPWEFDAARLVASGEVDAAVWVSALTASPPPWNNGPPVVAVVPPGTRLAKATAVVIEVAMPGRDHAGVLYDAQVGGLVAVEAAGPSTSYPTVSTVLEGVLARLPPTPDLPAKRNDEPAHKPHSTSKSGAVRAASSGAKAKPTGKRGGRA